MPPCALVLPGLRMTRLAMWLHGQTSLVAIASFVSHDAVSVPSYSDDVCAHLELSFENKKPPALRLRRRSQLRSTPTKRPSRRPVSPD